MPQGVQQAVLTIWGTLLLSALLALYQKLTGLSTEIEFIGTLFVYALCGILPYKIGNQSNAARYVYTVLTVISFLFLLAMPGTMKPTDLILSILLVPIEIFIIFRLFQQEASAWFAAR